MLCMHARPHRRKDQLPLRSLRDLCSRSVCAPVRPRLASWEHKRPQGAGGALEEMGTYPRHVLYFCRKFYLGQFDLFPKNPNFDPSCFDSFQKFGMSTRGLTLIFDPVPSTYFRPPNSSYRTFFWLTGICRCAIFTRS